MSRLSVHRISSLLLVLAVLAGCDYVERVSVDPVGGDSSGVSFDPSVSANGRYVVFWSSAGNLVPGDGNGVNDVFRRDVLTNTTTRVSLDAGGGDPNNESFYPSISATGRYVAFASSASDLVAGDTSALEDIFVRDMQGGTTTRVSVDASGGDPNQSTRHARISADGRHVVFASTASDLVTNDGNGLEDVFVRDLNAGLTTRASVDTTNGDANGASGSTFLFSPPAIDADGSHIVFFSAASDLVPMDGNGLSDVFVRDLDASSTTRVSVDTVGGDANGPSDQGNGRPGINATGNLVAFSSFASDLAAGDGNGAGSDVFVRNLDSATTTLVSAASSGGSGASISDDGRFVAFQTTQIWVHDRVTGTTALASARSGQPGNGISGNASVSADGRYVVFHSIADNLVTGDGNGTFDIYVRSVSMPTVASVSPNQIEAGHSTKLTVTGSGFLPGAKASASLFTPPGVIITSVKVKSETKLVLGVTVDGDAPLGPRDLLVWNPGTGPGAESTTFALCHGCFAVASGTHR